MQPKTRGARKQEAALEAGKFCGVAAAVIGSAVIGGVVASKGASKQADATRDANQANIEANKLDPHITDMLYGNGQHTLKPGVTPTYDNGPRQYDPETRQWTGGGMTNPESDYQNDTGLLGQFRGMLDTPQAAGLGIYGHAGDNYVGKFGAYDMEQQRDAAGRLMAGNTGAPQIGAASAQGVQVNAPSQNGMDLRPAYDRFINGKPGDNPFLTKAIGSGIDMSRAAFQTQQDDSTKNLMETVLPGIRSGAVMAGGYGGSRQGIAEGQAIGQFQKEQQRSLTNFGLGNTQAAVGAQAQAYDTDSNRALAATQGLGAQQYGVASQNATLAQNNSQFNAGLQQQTAQANQGATMGTNSLNSANTLAGIGATSGVLAGAYGVAGAQDQYDINRAGQVNNLLQPYLSKNPIASNVQPVYSNTGGAALGGAMTGIGLYNMYSNMNTGQPYGGAIGNSSQPYGSNGVY